MPMKDEPSKIPSRLPMLAWAGLALAVTFVLVGGGELLRHFGGQRVIARAVAPDGTEMCVVQRCNWSGEPFTTTFAYRKPGGFWGSFYFDHQDSYWGRSRVELDAQKGVAVFHRGDEPAITFAWPTETYTLHRLKRTTTGAPSRMPAGWKPEGGN